MMLIINCCNVCFFSDNCMVKESYCGENNGTEPGGSWFLVSYNIVFDIWTINCSSCCMSCCSSTYFWNMFTAGGWVHSMVKESGFDFLRKNWEWEWKAHVTGEMDLWKDHVQCIVHVLYKIVNWNCAVMRKNEFEGLIMNAYPNFLVDSSLKRSEEFFHTSTVWVDGLCRSSMRWLLKQLSKNAPNR